MTHNETVFLIDLDDGCRFVWTEVAESLDLNCKSVSRMTMRNLESLDYPAVCVIGVSNADSLEALPIGTHATPNILVGKGLQLAQAVAWMERGALTVLEQPVAQNTANYYVNYGISCSRRLAEMAQEHGGIADALQRLTPRQRSVLDEVVRGTPSKAIAEKLGVSKRLVELERSEILKAFGAEGTSDVTLQFGKFRILDEVLARTDQAEAPVLRSFATRLRVS